MAAVDGSVIISKNGYHKNNQASKICLMLEQLFRPEDIFD
jgi:hypothetical protein